MYHILLVHSLVCERVGSFYLLIFTKPSGNAMKCLMDFLKNGGSVASLAVMCVSVC